MQAAIGPGGSRRNSAGAGERLDGNTTETETRAVGARTPNVNGDDDALGDDVRADLTMGVDGIIHRVLPGAHRDMFITQRPRGGAVQHDVLINDQQVCLVRRLGQEAQLQTAIGPGGRCWHGAGTGRCIDGNAAEAESADALASEVNRNDDAQSGDVRADLAVRVDGKIHRVLPGAHRDLFIAQRPRGGAVQHHVLINDQYVRLVRRLGQEAQLQTAIGPGSGSGDRAGAGQPVDRDTAEAEASLAMAAAVNGDDDALGDDVRANLAVRVKRSNRRDIARRAA